MINNALGQNLETNNSVGEILFAITICVSGMFLFAVLIGNIQKYLQPLTIRIDEMKEKKKDTEKWMSNRRLPEDLKKRIRKYENYKWQRTRGTEEETLLRTLPKDLKVEAKRHFYLDYLRKVPPLSVYDERVLDELCLQLKTVLYPEKSYILREGYRYKEMLIIVRGNLIRSGSGTGSFNTVTLGPGDYCGESIVNWASLLPPNSPLPSSKINVQTLTEVECVVLSADDLKSVFTQYPNIYQSREVRDIFSGYSAEMQTWAANLVQAAWRRHRKTKHSKALPEEEEEGKLHNYHLQNDDSGLKMNPAPTTCNSRFPQMLSFGASRDSRVSYTWMKPNCVSFAYVRFILT